MGKCCKCGCVAAALTPLNYCLTASVCCLLDCLSVLVCFCLLAGLDVFAAERRSPVGWEPFIQAAAQHGAPQEVQMR